MKQKLAILAIVLCQTTTIVLAQSPFAGRENLFTTPLNYVAGFTSTPPVIDGNINDDVWKKAAWTVYFEDIEGDLKPKPYYETRMKMLWDDKYIYFAAELKDPHVWANLRKHDEIVFYDNDFEIFIDPSNTTHKYFEIEINALNTIFDLFLAKPYRNGGPAHHEWNTPGMLHAVNIQGTLNNASDEDKGWTVEIAVPFTALSMMGYTASAPKDNDIWRLNFSRVQWQTDIVNGKYVKKKDTKGKDLPEHNWVWSPQGVINMHLPERWGYVQFSKVEVGNTLPQFKMPYAEKQRQYLWLAYYKQKDFHAKNKRYAQTLKELGLQGTAIDVDGMKNTLSLSPTAKGFKITITDNKSQAISINNEGLIIK
ncbi:carbohydrate-binding family 9-like protein [Dysgonomonas sp. ZJ709]|uniref:carbohydrate-binding family 9-like protein n=1 Tax=Dysgonomonas sp. ZJ709 TaxID=2709797 RepID=UPI0013EE1D9C|nr:carbohydrate-binding family 9-like protein [Dysgonomonas sp. ZJ709]